MANSTYHPDHTNCLAWRGVNSAVPGTTLAVWQDTAYSSAERTNISTDDTSGVAQAGSGPSSYAGHETKFVIAEAEGDITQLSFSVKMTNATGPPTFYLWDHVASAWDSQGALSGNPATGTFNVTTSITDYVDASGDVYTLISYPTGFVTLTHQFQQLDVTYTLPDVEGALTVDMVTDASMDGAQRAIHGAVSIALATEGSGGSTVARGGALTVSMATEVLSGRPLVVHNAAVSIAMATDVCGGGDVGTLGALVMAMQTEVQGGGEKYLGGAVSIVMATDVAGGALVDFGGALSVGMETDVVGGGTKEPFGALSIGMETEVIGGGKLAYGGNLAVAIQTEVVGGGLVGVLGQLTIGMQTDIAGGGMRIFRAYVGVPAQGVVRLWWGREVLAYVCLDGQILVQTDAGYADLPADTAARMFLDVLGYLPPASRNPHDEVRLAWTESPTAVRYVAQRSPAVGDFETVAIVNALEWIDGPLDSGTYRCQVLAEDAEGDQTASLIESVTISTAPDAPSGIGYTWNPATKTLAISWTASPSPSAVDYTIRSSEGEPLLDLGAAPYATTALTTWSRVFTNQSGTYTFLVRARDALGREDANISQLVCVTLANGAIVARPAEPRIVTATAVEDGKIQVDWLYDPRYEDPAFSGAGFEGRIYWDAGTGTMDWDDLLATVAMGALAAATWFSWTSEALTNDVTYQFCVRIGTAAWPAGLETSNTDLHAATADSDVPVAPVLSVTVI